VAAESYELTARFNNASGLKEGSSVRVSGVAIGAVTKVTLKPDDMTALVSFRIPATLKLDDDTVAAVKSAGLIGEKFISLKPGSSGTTLKPAAVIVDTESSVDLEDIIARFAFGSVNKK
jgi:phospholipid/cholesterol/gamma-HCH transport system substrate-binding protein